MDKDITIVALILNDGTTLDLIHDDKGCDNCHFNVPENEESTSRCPKINSRLICMMSEDNANKVFKIKK
jgi:predicted Zn-ribbon and HTH transcriptional regulator